MLKGERLTHCCPVCSTKAHQARTTLAVDQRTGLAEWQLAQLAMRRWQRD